MPSSLETAQAIARALELSPDEGMFMQSLPTTFLAALARGEVNLVALAQEEMVSRGRDLRGRWVGFDEAKAQMTQAPEHLDQLMASEHARLEAFRARWQEAHARNPDQFPMAMASNNVGVWHEMVADFDPDAPFALPEPAEAPSPARSRRRTGP
jgi:hypothetical protein